ncbi:MAG TPA: hypothetical protein ENJ27_00180 [Candidatus Moranbacteria bacterium]|nr:hypothetical protein [Candidatus Moranbacteria bacterium]
MNIQKIIINFIKYYLPVLLWLFLIFSLSSMKGNATHKNIDIWFYIERKGAHIMEYFILTILLLRLFSYEKVERIKAIIFAGGISLLWAFSDEVHQLFVFGREGKISDVGIDFIGIFLAITLNLILVKYRRKI